MYLIPKELNSKIKITRSLHLKQFLLFLSGMGIVFLFDSLVYPRLVLVYYVFSALTLLFLLAPARHNPERYNYQAIYYALTRKKFVFHSISISETSNSDD